MYQQIATPPGLITWTKLGKPLKEQDPNIIIASGKLKSASLKWVQELRTAILAEQGSGYSFNILNSYLGPELLTAGYNKLKRITLYGPGMPAYHWTIRVKTPNFLFDIDLIRTTDTPLESVRKDLITPTAIRLSWPDENGKFRAYIHKGSKIAQQKFKATIPKTHLNRTELKNNLRWDTLRQYMNIIVDQGYAPIRKDICDIVRIVSEGEAEREQNAEYNRIVGA